MKRLIVLLMAAMLLVACGKQEEKPQMNNDVDIEREEVDTSNDEVVTGFEDVVEDIVKQHGEKTEDLKNELYALTLNEVLNDYDERYEIFDISAAIKLQEVVSSIARTDIDVARKMKGDLMASLTDEQVEVYGKFLDDIIDLEEAIERE